MIDLHCHILPGVDDGSLDLRDSLGMARQAVNDGIETICATPHIRHDHDVRIEEIAGRVEALNDRLRAEGIPVAVLRGGEVAETAVEGLSEEELRRVALGEGRWILLEPAPGPLGDSLTRPRRAPGRARPPHADRPSRAPPLGRHVRADCRARRRGRPGPGHRRLLPARADRRRDARPWPKRA